MSRVPQFLHRYIRAKDLINILNSLWQTQKPDLSPARSWCWRMAGPCRLLMQCDISSSQLRSFSLKYIVLMKRLKDGEYVIWRQYLSEDAKYFFLPSKMMHIAMLEMHNFVTSYSSRDPGYCTCVMYRNVRYRYTVGQLH